MQASRFQTEPAGNLEFCWARSRERDTWRSALGRQLDQHAFGKFDRALIVAAVLAGIQRLSYRELIRLKEIRQIAKLPNEPLFEVKWDLRFNVSRLLLRMYAAEPKELDSMAIGLCFRPKRLSDDGDLVRRLQNVTSIALPQFTLMPKREISRNALRERTTMYKNSLMSKEFTQLEQLAIHNHEAWASLQSQLVGIRIEKGASQAQMANRLGISQSAVSQFESVTTMPRLGSVLAYALAVGAELDLRATAVADTNELDLDHSE